MSSRNKCREVPKLTDWRASDPRPLPALRSLPCRWLRPRRMLAAGTQWLLWVPRVGTAEAEGTKTVGSETRTWLWRKKLAGLFDQARKAGDFKQVEAPPPKTTPHPGSF